MSRPVPLVFGAASVMTGGAYSTTSSINKLFDVLEETGITSIDAAQLYGDCEILLGRSQVSERAFTIDSKSPGGWAPGSLESAKLQEDAHKTLHVLGISKLSTFYIHGPDATIPPETWLPTINSLHKEGVFFSWGLSNFSPSDVESIHALCVKNDWVTPTIYQGNFSAFARHMQKTLFPTLRKLGMSFSAYSPLAGGFLARASATELLNSETGGRFAVDPTDPEGRKGGLGLYRQMYSDRPVLASALERWADIARQAGCSCSAELAYRWVCWDAGLSAEMHDKVTVGASRPDQLMKTVAWVNKGKLGETVCGSVDKLWEEIQDVAPLDNWQQVHG